KFLPVSELGWLFSHRRQFEPATLLRSSIRRQIKGFLDPAQVAAEHKRLGWAGIAVRAIVRSTSKRRHTDRAAAFSLPGDAKLDPDPDRLLRECDLSRIEHAPAVGSRLIARLSDWAMIAERRRNNCRRIARMARETGIGRPLRDDPPYTSCPYVLPLLVDEPEILYPAVRRTGVPVYRWDRQWP